ncbi:MAG: hypothetical protein AAGN46_01610 [Acidobacteriota bacterium]
MSYPSPPRLPIPSSSNVLVPPVVLLVAVVGFVLLSGTAVAGDAARFDVTLTTDASAYEAGELVRLTVTRCNLTSETITVFGSCLGCRDQFEIFDEAGVRVAESVIGGILVIVSDVFGPEECKSDVFAWDQGSGLFFSGDGQSDGQPVPFGSYTALYRWDVEGVVLEAVTAPFVLGEVTSIPTMSTTGLLAMCLVLALAGGWLSLRRRRALHPMSEPPA